MEITMCMNGELYSVPAFMWLVFGVIGAGGLVAGVLGGVKIHDWIVRVMGW